MEAPPPQARPAPALKPGSPGNLQRQRDSARRAYGRAIQLMIALLKGSGHQPPGAQDQVSQVTLELLDLLKADNQALVVLTARSTAGNYLYAHSVNVAILSMYVGLGLNWQRDQLQVLGLSALLCDIGMIKYLGLSQQPRALTAEEYQEVELHPLESQRMLEHVHGVQEATKRAVSEIIGQTRKTARLENPQLAAQIIGLCDLYEAISHQRSWREGLLPSEAVKTLIQKHKQDFSRALLQAFVEKISLFPHGSYVQLAGGEIACVIATHPKLPTRPTVEIRLKSDRSPQEPPLIVNLAENPLVHVSHAVDETKLEVGDKKILLAFQANRWWME